jgi:hypothetical protein
MPDFTIPMKFTGGSTGPPTSISLPDSTVLVPDGNGLVNVPASFLISMLSAGWQIQIDSGSTHVP